MRSQHFVHSPFVSQLKDCIRAAAMFKECGSGQQVFKSFPCAARAAGSAEGVPRTDSTPTRLRTPTSRTQICSVYVHFRTVQYCTCFAIGPIFPQFESATPTEGGRLLHFVLQDHWRDTQHFSAVQIRLTVETSMNDLICATQEYASSVSIMMVPGRRGKDGPKP